MTRQRTIAACLKAADRDAREAAFAGLTMADMHERLGTLHPRTDGPSPLRGLKIKAPVAGETRELRKMIDRARREMGEAEWQRLNQEWEA